MLIYKFWSSLSNYLKIRSLYLIFLSMAVTLLETLSLGLLIPVLVTITADNFFEKYIFLQKINFLLGNPDKIELLTIAILSFASVYVFKCLIVIYNTYEQGKFIYTADEYYTKNLFKNYIIRDLNFFLKSDTHEMVERIKTDIAHCVNCLNSYTTIISELIIVIGISIFLFFIEPFGFLIIVSAIMIASLIYYVVISKKIKQIGLQRLNSDEDRTKRLLEGFGGIREIKAFGIENIVLKDFNKMSNPRIRFFTKWNTIRNFPKIFFELIIILVATFLALFLLSTQNGIEKIIVVLGLFVVASFRIIPSLNKILVGLQVIHYGYYSAKLVFQNLEINDQRRNYNNSKSSLHTFDDEIFFQNISFTYDDRETNVYENLNLKIKKGELIALIGETGSGKSTLIDLLLGFQKPSRGKILLDNKDLSKNSLSKLIGYVPQNVYLFNTTIKENIAPGAAINEIDQKLIDECLEICELKKFLEKNNTGIETIVGEKGLKISGGEKQRIGLARALYKKPKILILDEATNALDELTEQKIYNKLFSFQKRMTIISIIHKPSLYKYFNRVIKVKDKSINEYVK